MISSPGSWRPPHPGRRPDLCELGALSARRRHLPFPQRGLRPAPRLLYGWTSFLFIMSGGIAAIAVRLRRVPGELPALLSTQHVLLTRTVGAGPGRSRRPSSPAVLAIVFLTVVNYFGLEGGGLGENSSPWSGRVRSSSSWPWGCGSPAAGAGRPTGSPSSTSTPSPRDSSSPPSGWRWSPPLGPTTVVQPDLSAGEMKDPGRSLPLG